MRVSIKKNFILTLLYNLLNILIPFITTPYIARVLGAEKIGIYSYSYSVAYYFVIFTMLGLNNYGNRTIATVRDDKDKLSKTFWNIYYMQLALSLILTGIYILYAAFLAENHLIAFLLLFYVVSAGFDITWFFFGIENFQFAVIRNLVIKVLDLGFILLFVKTSNDLWLYTLIMALGFFFSQLFLWTKIASYVHFQKPNRKESMKHVKPNLVLFIPVIAISIYQFMDKIMLGNLSNMQQVGFYDNSEKIIAIPQTAVTALGTVMLPRVSNLYGTKNYSGASQYLKKSILLVAAISSACTFGIVAIAPEFIHLYLGKGFEPCITLLYFLMPCLIFKAYANVIRTQYLIPLKNDNIYVISVCIGAGVNFLFNLLFIPHFQAIGACIGTILAEIIVCLYQMLFLIRQQNVGRYFLYGFVFQAIGTLMFIVLRFLPSLSNEIYTLTFKITCGSVLFIGISIAYFLLLRKRRIM